MSLNDDPGAGSNPYARILSIATAIVSTMSWGETLNVIAERIGEILFAWSASINSYDVERRTVTYEAYWCKGGASKEDLEYIGHISNIDERPDFRQLIDGRELVESRVDNPGLPAVERDVMKKWGLKTTLDGPLIYDGKVIGTVGVAETRFVRKFTPGELSLFAQLCELASIGVHNAQVFRAQQQTEARFAFVADLSDSLTSATSPDDVRAAVLSTAALALAAPTIALRESASAGCMSGVLRLTDDGLDADVRAEMTTAGDAVRLLVPLSAHDPSRGHLLVGWPDERHRVSDEDLEVARIIAAQTSLALAAVQRD